MKKHPQSPEQKKTVKTQKRLLLIALAVAAVCALLVWGLLTLLGQLGGSETAQRTQSAVDLQTYLAQEWPDYPLLEQENGTVRVQGTAKITYAQAEKYGAASYDQTLLETYVSTAKSIAASLAAECKLPEVVVVIAQYSTDGEVIFTAASDGSITTCWNP